MRVTTSTTIRLPEDGFNQLKSLADKQGKLVSQVIREALQDYGAKHGVALDLKVEYGGKRQVD